ncbi:major facilitator superfamily MFS-1 protein [Theileria orientalis]|uniref:Major facilitator superfamily MFS-1 protein n=1 Tax=Theileria orientalis TaxID=68886 RepID=A0A976M8U1_THEOR|nr:major facilitator superfamily MFS-1 protein [Theileria orientalis]
MKIRFLYRCGLYFIISMLISPYYDGWSSTAKYLISEGVFSECCCDTIDCSKLTGLGPVCDDQAFNVGKLLSFYRISEFLSSIFTGFFMDNCGPKLTIILAIVLRMLSWLLIPLYPNTTGVVILSCILCGIASNGVAFPVFTIAQYTKRFYNPAMIAISISLCFGTLYMFILNYIKEMLPPFKPIVIIVVMLVLTHVPLLVLAAFIFPNSLQKDVKLNSPKPPSLSKEKAEALETLSFSNSSASEGNIYGRKYVSDQKITSIEVEMNSTATLVYTKLDNKREDLKSDDTDDVQAENSGEDDELDGLKGGPLPHSESNYAGRSFTDVEGSQLSMYKETVPPTNSASSEKSLKRESRAHLYEDGDVVAQGSKDLEGVDDRWRFWEFLAILRRVDILTISFASMVGVISLTFAQESFPISYGRDKLALKVNEILIPISFIFSLGSVFLLDRIGPVPIIVGMNVISCVLHLTMMFVDTILSIFTSILMSLGYSLFMTQYYLYLDNQVPLKYQGSIKGFLVTSIGFVIFINIGLNYLSKTYFYTREIHLALLILRIIVTVPLIKFLRHTRRRSSGQEIIQCLSMNNYTLTAI